MVRNTAGLRSTLKGDLRDPGTPPGRGYGTHHSANHHPAALRSQAHTRACSLVGQGKREFHKGASEDADALREQSKLPEDEEQSAHPEGDGAEQRPSS